MSTTLTGRFQSRSQADLVVEHLVQEIGIERTDIFVSAEGSDNSAGTAAGGADGSAIGQAARDDVPLAGPIMVSVDLQDETHVDVVRTALAEFETQV